VVDLKKRRGIKKKEKVCHRGHGGKERGF